jgi:hypothetical protein
MDVERVLEFNDTSLPSESGFYVRHLVDGRRSVVDVWNVLRAIFPATSLTATESYLRAMDAAGLVRMAR